MLEWKTTSTFSTKLKSKITKHVCVTNIGIAVRLCIGEFNNILIT